MFPQNTEQVVGVVKACNAFDGAFLPRGEEQPGFWQSREHGRYQLCANPWAEKRMQPRCSYLRGCADWVRQLAASTAASSA